MATVVGKFSLKKEVCLDEHQILLSNRQIGIGNLQVNME